MLVIVSCPRRKHINFIPGNTYLFLKYIELVAYSDNSPFLSASTGDSFAAFFAGNAAAKTDNIMGNNIATKIVSQFTINPIFNCVPAINCTLNPYQFTRFITIIDKIIPTNPAITPKFVVQTMDKEWNWSQYGLSSNPAISPEFIIRNINEEWDWGEFGLSRNPAITPEFVMKNISQITILSLDDLDGMMEVMRKRQSMYTGESTINAERLDSPATRARLYGPNPAHPVTKRHRLVGAGLQISMRSGPAPGST